MRIALALGALNSQSLKPTFQRQQPFYWRRDEYTPVSPQQCPPWPAALRPAQVGPPLGREHRPGSPPPQPAGPAALDGIVSSQTCPNQEPRNHLIIYSIIEQTYLMKPCNRHGSILYYTLCITRKEEEKYIAPFNIESFFQCYGHVSFWCGSVSWITDPTPDLT